MKTSLALALIVFAASIAVVSTPAKAVNCTTSCVGKTCFTSCN